LQVRHRRPLERSPAQPDLDRAQLPGARPSRYVLKGGANLRYFFESVRYSEGIDLDGVLGASALPVLLRGGGLAVEGFSKPKQTETTQRWKIALTLAGRNEPLRTKIEFSRRNGDDRHVLESVPARVVAAYALRSPSVRHYDAQAATEQKVEALAGRSETQARDVFDLELLLRPNAELAAALPAALREPAAERALGLPFAAFRDQVLPFLDPEAAELYVDPATWEQIRGYVVERLLQVEQ